jgi:hypothetical protein
MVKARLADGRDMVLKGEVGIKDDTEVANMLRRGERIALKIQGR